MYLQFLIFGADLPFLVRTQSYLLRSYEFLLLLVSAREVSRGYHKA